jgi:hypothetical protein
VLEHTQDLDHGVQGFQPYLDIRHQMMDPTHWAPKLFVDHGLANALEFLDKTKN